MSRVKEIALQTARGEVVGRPLDCFTADEAAKAIQKSFEGYFVPMRMDEETFERRFRAEHVDRRESRIFVQGTQIAGIILVARRWRVSRIATMGCSPAFRRCGLGAAMLEAALDSAKDRGDDRITLEVLEPNHPARRLYARLGFLPVRELVGYVHRGKRQSSGENMQECSAQTYAEALAREGFGDLPWTLSAHTACGQTLPERFFHIDGASFVWVAAVTENDLAIRFLFTTSKRRREGAAGALLCSLERQYPNRKWSISPVVPEGMGSDFLRKRGFLPRELRQIEMVHVWKT
jgi:ribosomal protein S18 acetylase RimI-like enzyme